MEGESKRTELRDLVEAIKATDGLESRISLISQLGDSYQSEVSEVAFVVECLTTFWEDSTCMGLSQCMLNKTILQVAAKYLELDTTNSPVQFLILGTKASIWCGKHLQMTIVSIEEFNDETHLILFSQIILDSLNFSSATMTALTRSPILGEKVEMLIVENFILEVLNITKASILENKRIHSIASQVLKAAQMVLDAAIKLCRAYSQAVRWDCYEKGCNKNGGTVDGKGVDNASHIINIAACTIENLYELGTFAASGGGSMVTILNVSWKGVVSLLQLGKRALAEKINVGDIILTLVSLASESLRCAAEAWCSTLKEPLTISEAKRIFLPIKFYLINAVRISSEYPCESMNIYREITRSVLIISSLGIFWSKETHLTAASEALAEFLEPTSFLLLHTLLNSAYLEPESRVCVLEWLFTDEMVDGMDSASAVVEKDSNTSVRITFLDSIFNVNCDSIPRSNALLLGRVIVFLNLLKTSHVFKEEMILAMSRKLDLLLNVMMHEDVYSSILGLCIPVLSGSGSTSGVVWQSMLCFILNALKTFMIVASSGQPRMEVETFLLQNIFHPHFLCLEIVKELWCFLVSHADLDLVNHLLDRFCLLLKDIASSEPLLVPLSALRKMARSICILLTYTTPSSVDLVYRSILNDDDSFLSSIMYVALLMEGFPLNSLSDKMRMLATRKISNAFCGYIENYSKEIELNDFSGSRNSSLFGLPVYALSYSLLSGEIKSCSVIDEKNVILILRFAVCVIHGYQSATDNMKDHYRNLISATLDIISNTKHIYGYNEIGEVFSEFHTLLLASSVNSDALLYQCKPSLASFLAGLGHMELSEADDNALCSAVCDLYHVLLRERHWAFIHLAIASFGYFAARTTCTKLWRFVPHDAALSFDTHTGNEAKEERFMSELKGYLEKEGALCAVTPCKEQLNLLVKEGMVLKNLGKVVNTVLEVPQTETMEMGDEKCVKNRKRKLPGEIFEGMELLQSGLKVLNHALAQDESEEWREVFLTHVSCLEDVICHLTSLSDKSLNSAL